MRALIDDLWMFGAIDEPQHAIIYRKEGRFAGWPANYGIWSWGDEIVVGFTLGYMDTSAGFHKRSREKPFITMQARSLDGGMTWDVQKMPCRTPGDRGLSADEHAINKLKIDQVLNEDNAIMDYHGGINFTHPDFALMCARSGLRTGARSWFYYSYDRCKSWKGPFNIPMFNLPGIAARTDYIVFGKDECMFFLTAAKSDGDEGRVFCAKTANGGKKLEFVSWITHEPEGFTIMPASVRLSDSVILVAVRCRGGKDDWIKANNWIDIYRSDDKGNTWQYINRPVENTGTGGNPPTLTKLQDGRLCMTYGYRDMKFGIKAKISKDNGETWSDEIVLRDDGGDPDIGYPRTVQRADGKIVTAYYFNENTDGERFIGATVWNP